MTSRAFSANSPLAGRGQWAWSRRSRPGRRSGTFPSSSSRVRGTQPFAIMIARGDLAVEVGYKRMAEIQEELLWLCEAAHVPVIWATQVLDNFVKKGVQHRAEMTDAAMAERAECVMLNKGPLPQKRSACLTACWGGWRATSSRRRRGCGPYGPGPPSRPPRLASAAASNPLDNGTTGLTRTQLPGAPAADQGRGRVRPAAAYGTAPRGGRGVVRPAPARGGLAAGSRRIIRTMWLPPPFSTMSSRTPIRTISSCSSVRLGGERPGGDRGSDDLIDQPTRRSGAKTCGRRVRKTGGYAAVVYAADKISKVRELRTMLARGLTDEARGRLEPLPALAGDARGGRSRTTAWSSCFASSSRRLESLPPQRATAACLTPARVHDLFT